MLTRRTPALTIGCIALASFASSCHKEISAESIEKSPDAIAEQGPSGTSTWIVQPDGHVSAALQGPDGKPIAKPVVGQLSFGNPDGPSTPVPVQYDPKSGVLTAAGPKLNADITPITYDLTVGGAPWNGMIGVPPGGTHDLADTGKMQAAIPPGTVGPNGGAVESVGPDRVELLANKRTGDVRAYVLDADNHPVDPGDRKITVAVEGDHPSVTALTPEPQAHFVVGHVPALVDAPEVTVAVNAHGATHACLVGWAPGSVVLMGPDAPRVHVLAVDAWPDEAIEVRGRHGVVGAPGVVVNAPGVVVNTPGIVVGLPGVVVDAPGVVVGGGVVVHDRGHWGHGHDHDHDHGHGR